MDQSRMRREVPEEGDNVLNTNFGNERKESERAPRRGATYLDIDSTIYAQLKLSVVARLVQTAEKMPDALRYFPDGSRLMLSAEGERGDYTESGWLRIYCELKFPVGNGRYKSSGKESIASSQSAAESGLRKFLRDIAGEGSPEVEWD